MLIQEGINWPSVESAQELEVELIPYHFCQSMHVSQVGSRDVNLPISGKWLLPNHQFPRFVIRCFVVATATDATAMYLKRLLCVICCPASKQRDGSDIIAYETQNWICQGQKMCMSHHHCYRRKIQNNIHYICNPLISTQFLVSNPFAYVWKMVWLTFSS